ncbi:FAD-linked oxidase-like protein [Pyrenochaeta sp. DS3sAY3a]|nr:FAD-linked oxidase-like protein [Pyrenochaeta sp. DS3sAY3a]
MASTSLPEGRYKDSFVLEKHRELFSAKNLLTPLETPLPPGVTRDELNLAIQKFVALLGSDGVFIGDALVDYVDPYELWEQEGRRKVPSAAVCPRSVEQVQGVIKIAREFKIPLWTFSRGKNLGYGGPAPRVNGSVSLDLHRMDKVIEVNEKFAYAVVEPGVTFFDLYNHIAKNELKVWPSVATLGWGSVLGNTLDRGIGFIPTSNHHQHITGLEVVLGTGEILRTGQWAMDSSPLAHTSKYSFGPSLEGLFIQSNLAVVTKLSIGLVPQPQAYYSCVLDMPELEDLGTIVEMVGPMRTNGTLGTSSVYINNVLELTAPIINREKVWGKKEPMPESLIKKIQKDYDIGYWNAQFGLYGPKLIVQAQFEEVKRIVHKKAPTARIRGQMFEGETEGALVDALKVPFQQGGIFCGVPGMDILPMVKYRLLENTPGIAAHCDYSAFLPTDGKSVTEWVTAARDIHAREGWDFFCNVNIHERHALAVHLMAYDKSDADQRKAVDRVWFGLYDEANKRRLGSYRCHVNHMEPLSKMYDFNNHAYRRFVESIKDTVDPDGILSPGKMGIWPKRLRAEKEKL